MEEREWWGPYIAGLVDNRATLYVTLGKDSNRLVGYVVKTGCEMKIESHDVYRLIVAYCDAEDIYYRTDEERDTTYDSYGIQITRRDDLQKFLNTLRPYLVARERGVKILCDTIIPKLDRGDHGEKASFIELMEDIEAFREKVGRANRSKYTSEYFKDEWDITLDSD